MTPQERDQHMRLHQQHDQLQHEFDSLGQHLALELSALYVDANVALQHIVRTTLAHGPGAAAQLIQHHPDQLAEIRDAPDAHSFVTLADTVQQYCTVASQINQAQLNLTAFEEAHFPRSTLYPQPPLDDQEEEEEPEL